MPHYKDREYHSYHNRPPRPQYPYNSDDNHYAGYMREYSAESYSPRDYNTRYEQRHYSKRQ